jgi:hypothetical protein
VGGAFSGFTAFDFSMALVIPVVCIGTTVTVVLLNFLSDRGLEGEEEKAGGDMEKQFSEEEVRSEKVEEVPGDTVQMFVELEADDEEEDSKEKDRKSKIHEIGSGLRSS